MRGALAGSPHPPSLSPEIINKPPYSPQARQPTFGLPHRASIGYTYTHERASADNANKNVGHKDAGNPANLFVIH